jgi:predicted small secreted protein
MIIHLKYQRSLVLLTLLLVSFSIGCNTYRGFGKDVSNTGDAIQDKK